MSIDSSKLPSSCQSYPPEQDNSNAGVMGSQLLKSMGAQEGCDLQSYYAAIGGSASAGPGGMLGSAEFSAQMNGLKKSGCQVMAAVVGNYLNSIYQSRCVIENDSTNVVTNITIENDISFNAIGPNSVISSTCSNLDWAQNATIQTKALSNISSSSATTIASVAQAGLATTAKQIGRIKEGFQGTSSGSKMIQAIQSKLIQASQSSQVKNAITNIVNKYQITNTMSMSAIAGGALQNIVPCKFTQNAVIDAQLASIISNAYTASVKDSISSFLKSEQGQAISVVSEGAPNVVGAMFANNWMYIVGAIVAVVLGLFLLKFLKSKNANKMLETVSKNPALLKGGFRYHHMM